MGEALRGILRGLRESRGIAQKPAGPRSTYSRGQTMVVGRGGFSASKEREMLESRSALDWAVHTRGGQVLEQAAWHPVGRPAYPGLAQFKEWREKEGEDM